VLSQFNAIEKATPQLSVAPDTLDFDLQNSELALQIANGGGGDLIWTISENPDVPWITEVSPISGTGVGEVTVRVSRLELAFGTHTGMLSVTSNGGDQDIPVLIRNLQKGDVNGDGDQNILDILLLISFINEIRIPTADEFFCADCNGDDLHNIQDIVQLIQWINGAPLLRIQATAAPVRLTVASSAAEGVENLSFRLSTSQNVAGIQLRLRLDSNAAIPRDLIRCGAATFDYSIMQSGNELLILIYSSKGALFGAGEHLLLDLPIKRGTRLDLPDAYAIEEAVCADPLANVLPLEIQTQGMPESNRQPGSYALGQNYPNPFNSATHFTYSAPAASRITITIYNAVGQAIRTLWSGQRESGVYALEWDGTDDSGAAAASGLYFCILRANQFTEVRKMALLR